PLKSQGLAQGSVSLGTTSPETEKALPLESVLHHDISGDEDEFRDAVLDCMFKAIGLSAVDSALNPPNSSVEASPRLVSYDSIRQKAFFTHGSQHGSHPPGTPLSHSPTLSSLPAFGQHSFPLVNGSQSSLNDDEER